MYSISLNLTELEKLEKKQSKKGDNFVNCIMFLNDEPDQFNNVIQLKTNVNGKNIFVGSGKKIIKKNNENNDLPF